MGKNSPALKALKLSIDAGRGERPDATCRVTPEINGFAGLSQVWELHDKAPGAMLLIRVTLAGVAALSRRCMFNKDDEVSRSGLFSCRD